MQYQIQYRPAYALAVISLDTGESIQAEAGAMVSMASTIKMNTSVRGGLFAGLRRSVLGGESFFINTFTAEAAGDVTVAPALPGDITGIELTGGGLYVQSGSFLAATMDVTVETKWGGAKTFFSHEGLFLLKCTGTGTVWVSSYGAIHPIQLGGGEPSGYVVDTGHMVAFDESVTYEVGRIAGWKSTVFGGEGLVCKLTGPGRFFLQTRNPNSFLEWLIPKLPTRRE
jgi:uncharacterized protein (TIGR00266 family)